jgi:hypothetical protein
MTSPSSSLPLVAALLQIVDPTHPGAIHQLSSMLHTPALLTDLLLLGLVAHGAAGLLPGSLTWSEANFRVGRRRGGRGGG